jgi:GH15 family glucan-1,4-alpha-glucosidase
MSAAKGKRPGTAAKVPTGTAGGRQSAAMPSPFPPIADYAFLSDCHTGALVAPDGAVGWLCVPQFDAPSVFGTLLDREAGYFRLGPFGISFPAARAYEPGTHVLVTTWQTASGWVVVRDALTMGPRQGEDRVTPHTRPPADDERLRNSVLAIADELTEHGFVLRYRTEETDDGMSGKEGTFLICSFWLVSALAIIGERQRARDLMERLLRLASPLGLYAEEFDADTGHHLGNFPQAFSHLALIEAAARIIVAERLEEVS